MQIEIYKPFDFKPDGNNIPREIKAEIYRNNAEVYLAHWFKYSNNKILFSKFKLVKRTHY